MKAKNSVVSDNNFSSDNGYHHTFIDIPVTHPPVEATQTMLCTLNDNQIKVKLVVITPKLENLY